MRWGGVGRRRHRQLFQEEGHVCAKSSERSIHCSIHCVCGVGGAGRGWRGVRWRCICNRRCGRLIGLAAVVVIVVISAMAIVAAAIIVGTKRKLFYGSVYGTLSTVSCWM